MFSNASRHYFLDYLKCFSLFPHFPRCLLNKVTLPHTSSLSSSITDSRSGQNLSAHMFITLSFTELSPYTACRYFVFIKFFLVLLGLMRGLMVLCSYFSFILKISVHDRTTFMQTSLYNQEHVH